MSAAPQDCNMSSLYTHIFSHQAALRRTSFQHGLKRATHPLRRATIISPLRARPSSNHVTPNRVVAGVGIGLASAGLGLLFNTNFQKLNCERESIIVRGNEFWLRTRQAKVASSQPRSTAASKPSDLGPLPPDPESTVNMYELTFGTVCGVCAGVFVKKGAKTLAFVFGGIFVLLQVSPAYISLDAISEVRSHNSINSISAACQ